MRIISYTLIFIVMLFGVTFAILNANPVPLNFYLGNYQIALSLLLVMAFGLGLLIGLFFGLVVYLKLTRRNSRLKKRVKIAEQEIENLRSIPIQDST